MCVSPFSLQQLERKVDKCKVYEGFPLKNSDCQCYSKAPAVSFTVITATGIAQFAPGSGYQQSAVQGCAGVHLAADGRSSRERVRPISWVEPLCLVSTVKGQVEGERDRSLQ